MKSLFIISLIENLQLHVKILNIIIHSSLLPPIASIKVQIALINNKNIHKQENQITNATEVWPCKDTY